MKTILIRALSHPYIIRIQCIYFLLLMLVLNVNAQQKFSKYEYLHGKLTPLRTCFDVKHYDITINVQPERKFISGSNVITFRVEKDFQKLQLDLFAVMHIDSMLFYGKRVMYTRDSNAVFVDLGIKIRNKDNAAFSISNRWQHYFRIRFNF